MAVGTEATAVRYEDVSAGTPISVPFPLYEALDVKVYYGSASLIAVYNTDYTIALEDDFDTFTLTPTASLLTKINNLIAADPVNEENYITVRRVLDYQTDATAAAVRYTPFTSREFDRTVLRFQQIQEQLNRAIVLSPKFVGTQPLLELSGNTADRTLIFNNDGSQIIPGPTAGEISSAEAHAADALASKNAAATSASAAAGSASAAAAAKTAIEGSGILDYAGNDGKVPVVDGTGYTHVTPDALPVAVTNLPDTAQTIGSALTELDARQKRARFGDMDEVRPVLDRLAPKVCMFEPWQLTAFGGWVNRDTGLAAPVTKAHVWAWVKSKADEGYDMIAPLYVEQLGWSFTRPTQFDITTWYDYFTAANVRDYIATYPALHEDMDLIEETILAARAYGIQYGIDVGRVALWEFMDHLHNGTSYAGLTHSQEKDLATARTRQLFADLHARFGGMDHVTLYGIGFEPSYMSSFAPWAATVTTAAQTGVYPYEHPPMNAYGKDLLCTPAVLIDLPASAATLATKEMFAAQIVQTGFQIFAKQFAAGPGYDYTTDQYTYVTSRTTLTAPAFFARLREVFEIANALYVNFGGQSLSNFGKGVVLALMPERWRMGDKPTVTATLSAISGATVTVTFGGAGLPAGVDAFVNRWFYAGDGGRGQIVDNSGLPNSVVIDTTVSGGASFTTTNYAANADGNETWALVGDATGIVYTRGYPMDNLAMLQQYYIAGKYAPMIFVMGGPPYDCADTLPLALPASAFGRADLRAEADAAYDYDASWRRIMKRRVDQTRTVFGVPRRYGAYQPGTLAGSPYSKADMFNVKPRWHFTRVLVRLIVRAYRFTSLTDPGVATAFRMRINNVEVGAWSRATGKGGGFGGDFVLEYEYEADGSNFNVGLSAVYDSASGHITISDVECTVYENP